MKNEDKKMSIRQFIDLEQKVKDWYETKHISIHINSYEDIRHHEENAIKYITESFNSFIGDDKNYLILSVDVCYDNIKRIPSEAKTIKADVEIYVTAKRTVEFFDRATDQIKELVKSSRYIESPFGLANWSFDGASG